MRILLFFDSDWDADVPRDKLQSSTGWKAQRIVSSGSESIPSESS
jgi:hypothetical protein